LFEGRLQVFNLPTDNNTKEAIVIPLFGFELIQLCILIVQIIKKSKMNKLEQKKQSGGQNQNGCQA
jgi:hypothetical protein